MLHDLGKVFEAEQEGEELRMQAKPGSMDLMMGAFNALIESRTVESAADCCAFAHMLLGYSTAMFKALPDGPDAVTRDKILFLIGEKATVTGVMLAKQAAESAIAAQKEEENDQPRH